MSYCAFFVQGEEVITRAISNLSVSRSKLEICKRVSAGYKDMNDRSRC